MVAPYDKQHHFGAHDRLILLYLHTPSSRQRAFIRKGFSPAAKLNVTLVLFCLKNVDYEKVT